MHQTTKNFMKTVSVAALILGNDAFGAVTETVTNNATSGAGSLPNALAELLGNGDINQTLDFNIAGGAEYPGAGALLYNPLNGFDLQITNPQLAGTPLKLGTGPQKIDIGTVTTQNALTGPQVMSDDAQSVLQYDMLSGTLTLNTYANNTLSDGTTASPIKVNVRVDGKTVIKDGAAVFEITGAGPLEIAPVGAGATIEATSTIANPTATSGTVTAAGTFAGLVTNTGTLTSTGALDGGLTNTGGSTTLDTGGSVADVSVTGGTVNATSSGVNGNASTGAAGTFNLSAGQTVGGTLTNAGTATIGGTVTGLATNSGTLTSTGALDGGLTNNGGSTTLDTGGSVADVSVTGGTVNATSSGVNGNASTGAAGTFNLSAGQTVGGNLTNAGTATIDGTVVGTANNTGTVTIGGTIASATTNTGILTSTGNLNGGLTNNNGTATLNGGFVTNVLITGGTVNVTSGSVTGNASIGASGTFNLSAGQTVDGTLINGGTATIDGTVKGTTNNTGTATINGTIESSTSNSGTLTSTGDLDGGLSNSNGTANINNGSVAHVIVSGGTVNVANAASITGFVSNAGTLDIDTDIGGTFTSTGGTADIAGNVTGLVTNTSGATTITGNLLNGADVNGGTLNVTGNISGADLNVFAGTADITGDIALSVTNNAVGTAIINGIVGGTVNNFGTFTSIGALNGGLTNNNGTANINSGSVADVIVSGGTVNVANAASITGNVTNAGTVDIDTDIGGTFTSTGGTADIAGNVTGLVTNTLGATTITGNLANGAQVDGGTLTVTGNINGADLTVNGGTATVTGDIAQNVLNNAGGIFNFTAGTLTGLATNAGTFTSTGALDGGLTNNNGTANINSGSVADVTVTGGTVNVASAASITGNVSNAGTLDIDTDIQGTFTSTGGMATIDGNVTGLVTNTLGVTTITGNLAAGAQVGGGTLNVTGDINGADLTVNGGTATVIGTVAQNAVVGTNGTFNLTGTVTGNLTNSGIFSLANGIGTANVGNNFTQTSSGRFNVEIANPNQEDQLIVNGNVTIDGVIQVTNIGPASINDGQEFDLLTTNGTITDNGVTVTSNLLDDNTPLTFTLLVDSKNIKIVTGILTMPGATGNIQSLLGAAPEGTPLNNAFQNLIRLPIGNAPGQTNDFVAQLTPSQNANKGQSQQNSFGALVDTIRDNLINVFTSNGESNGALNSPSEAFTTAAQTTNIADTAKNRLAFNDRQIKGQLSNMVELKSIVENVSPMGNTTQSVIQAGQLNIWSQLYYGARFKGREGIYSGFKSHTGGIVAGAGYKLSPNTLVGGALSYQSSRMNVKLGRGKSDINGGSFTAYGSRVNLPSVLGGKLYTNGSVTAGLTRYDEDRVVSTSTSFATPTTFTAKNKHTSYDGVINAEIGSIHDATVMRIKPYGIAGVTYIHEKGYTEKNAGGLNLVVRSKNTALLNTELGTEIWRKIETLNTTITPSFRLGWAYKKLLTSSKFSSSFQGQSGNFKTVGQSLSDHFVKPSAKIDIAVTQSINATGYVKSEFGRKYHAAEGGLKISKRL